MYIFSCCKACFISLSAFSRFIYETEHFNGVAELLEILGRFVSTQNHTRHVKRKICYWLEPGLYSSTLAKNTESFTFFQHSLKITFELDYDDDKLFDAFIKTR